MDEKMVNDLKHDLALLTQDEKDNLFSFIPQKFNPIGRLPGKLANEKKNKDAQLEIENPQSTDNNAISNLGDSTKMIPEEYMVPNHDFLVNIPETEFLEKLRSMEEEAKSKLNFHDLEFPSNMMIGNRLLENVEARIPPKMLPKLNKEDSHSENTAMGGKEDSVPELAKRSDEVCIGKLFVGKGDNNDPL